MGEYVEVVGVSSGAEGVFSRVTRRIVVTKAPEDSPVREGHEVNLAAFPAAFGEESDDWETCVLVRGTETLLFDALLRASPKCVQVPVRGSPRWVAVEAEDGEHYALCVDDLLLRTRWRECLVHVRSREEALSLAHAPPETLVRTELRKIMRAWTWRDDGVLYGRELDRYLGSLLSPAELSTARLRLGSVD